MGDGYNHVGTPKSAENGNPSRIEGNPSLCLTDGGPWTACVESRNAIARAFDCHRWNSILAVLD